MAVAVDGGDHRFCGALRVKVEVNGVRRAAYLSAEWERLGDPRYTGVLHDYVTSVLTQFRTDNRILGWDMWNEPDNPARV